MSHGHGGDIHQIRRIPNPQEPVPSLALPSFALFLASLLVWFCSSALAVTGSWPWPITTIVNSLATFAFFTVLHECSHNTLSSRPSVNSWVGRIAAFFLAPFVAFRSFRFIHMQHHRFTNFEDGEDPDHYASRGPRWQAPLRWLTLDVAYVRWYWPKLRRRPAAEQREALVIVVVGAGAIAALIATGNLLMVGLACWLVPARLATLLLAWSFDYLPHHELHHTQAEDRFKATRNRIGLERLLTPLMLYQNYHLVHHLHPVIPFYRYIAVWRRNEEQYLERDPALCTAGGRPLTVAEYRQLREMQ